MSNRNRGVKFLVVIESPGKAKTIEKILGNEYTVKASFGHVSDLPKSRLGIDVDNNFKAEYSVTPDKRKVVKELKSFIGPGTIVYISSDDDREGNVIGHSLIDALKLKEGQYKRVVYNEITKAAVLKAFANPIELDMGSVHAGITRRLLDRIVGYKLSPLLWTKIKYGLSAGRVQSVALRIIADREAEIDAFIPDEYWKISLDILSNPKFRAELSKIDGKKHRVTSGTEANLIKDNCEQHDYTLSDVIEKEAYRTPPAPFTTSTLQQAASSKMGFGVKMTMNVAQALYEGNFRIPNVVGGLITYMRTDSVMLSKTATDAAKATISKLYGNEYTLTSPRTYKTKSKGAQEAHEAIRPANMSLLPSDIEKYVGAREFKLYRLIWMRTIATQMSAAKVANTTYKILGGDKQQYEYTAKGTKVLFPGFLKAYTVGTDDVDSGNNDNDKYLPNVPKGTVFTKTKLLLEQLFTKPPARYNEASLVRKLETEGVGRPSTYASTISTLMTREYVEKTSDNRLTITTIGKAVSGFLVENFSNIVDIKFTANLENELDKIANNTMKWTDVLHNFYGDFIKVVNSKQDVDRVPFGESKVLGKDKASGLDIIAKTGSYGSYISIGTPDKEKGFKPKISPIPKGVSIKDITLETAKHYMKIPRILGKTKNGDDIKAAIGIFGPMLQVKSTYYTVMSGDDIYELTLPRALEIIKEIDDAKAKALWWTNKDNTLQVIDGRYGVYVVDKRGKKRINHKIPKDTTKESLVGKDEKYILSILIKPSGKKPKGKYKK